jgi:hypothetical protein
MMRALLIISAALLTLSAPPLILMAREIVLGTYVDQRYAVKRIGRSANNMQGEELRANIGGHTVELADDQPHLGHEPFTLDDRRANGVVRIIVDGRPATSPVSAIVRLNYRDANRYWGFVYLMRLVDRAGKERLVVAQHLGKNTYRTVSIFSDGNVVQDEFDYAGRCSPPLRAALIRYVVPHPAGYCSDLMQVWPSLFYPVLYPWGSGLAGLSGIALAGTSRHRRRIARLS